MARMAAATAAAAAALGRRSAATAAGKLHAPPMVYVKGEEMTRFTMERILEQWIHPRLDTSKWEVYDLSAKNRDDTSDQALSDVIAAGKRVRSIFKEPTITPTADQVSRLGISKPYPSPNGAMRAGWNGITISRDTIHIPGIPLGYKGKVLFDRHAVGGEYSAGHAIVPQGRVVTMYMPMDKLDTAGVPMHDMVLDSRDLNDDVNAVVTYSNPLDGVSSLAHHFFSRCLHERVTPYVVTKKSVFKWQEAFWERMRLVFDNHYHQQFRDAGLLPHGELEHLLSDAATMKLISWTDGNFGMAAHNYDGDVLTDEMAQVHKSPGFVSSSLIGDDGAGNTIKEFEASHGTCADMNDSRLRGEPTSLNPLGMVEGLIGALDHAAEEHGPEHEVKNFTATMRSTIHKLFQENRGTQDLCGPDGKTTEQFIDTVANELDASYPAKNA